MTGNDWDPLVMCMLLEQKGIEASEESLKSFLSAQLHINHATYFLNEILCLIQKADSRFSDPRPKVDAVHRFDFDSKYVREYVEISNALSALATAALNSINSFRDNISHGAYYALVSPPHQEKLYAKDIKKALAPYPDLVTMLDKLHKDRGITYVNMLVNASKHQSIVETELSTASLESDQMVHSATVPKFGDFDPRDLVQTLDETLSTLEEFLVDFGHGVTETVRKK